MSDGRSSFFGTAFTFLTGAVIGAGFALLFAPYSGDETRKKIKDVSDKTSEDVKENYEKISKEAQKTLEKVKELSDNAVKQVKAVFEEVKKEGLSKIDFKKPSAQAQGSAAKAKKSPGKKTK